MKRYRLASLLLAYLIPGTLVAKDCAMEQNTMAIEICHEDQYAAADKELNQLYQQAMKSLPAPAKAKLQAAQRLWLKSRDANLALMAELMKDSGSYGGVVYADYKSKQVQKRVQELKYMLADPTSSVVAW